jgi:hypothetical protein
VRKTTATEQIQPIAASRYAGNPACRGKLGGDGMKKIFTKGSLILMGKVTVSIVGVATSALIFNNFGDYTGAVQIIPGFLFGILVLIWSTPGHMKGILNWRSAVFLIAAGGIYLTIWYLGVVTTVKYLFNPDEAAMITLVCFILTCTVPLPIAHALLLGAAWKRTLVTVTTLLGIITVVLVSLNSSRKWGCDPDFLFAGSLAIWQAAYLVSMFGFRKREQLEEGQVEATV